MFAALDDEESSTLYWTCALIYSLPYLANGLEVDGFALLTLLLGAAHVQARGRWRAVRQGGGWAVGLGRPRSRDGRWCG